MSQARSPLGPRASTLVAAMLALASAGAAAQSTGNLTIGGQVQPGTCALQSDNLVLDPLSADDLGTPSASTHFNVRMLCPLDGIVVELTLRDAGDPDLNVGHHLSRTAGSTARGVAIGLFRNGQPVAFNTPWLYGTTVRGDNLIGLTARYVRTREALVVSGSLGGTALLRAEYR